MPKLYVVCPVVDGSFYTTRQFSNGYQALVPHRTEDNPDLAFFTDQATAHGFAQAQAAINGGRELCVLETTHQYFCQPSQVRSKIWEGKELIPT